jgi:RNA polymerase sigma factor (sigma-70 family)
MELSDRLFRREAGRMVAALTRVFGIHNVALAEDVVQEAFCRAIEVWTHRGVPENPSAWLMTTAKNRALDVIRRERTARTFAPEVGRFLESEWTLTPVIEEVFGANAIRDDQLRMMFSCCDPRLPEQAQVALVLRILCGFSVGEIASAFVCNPAAMEKRITRAKKELAASRRLFDVKAGKEFTERLPAVQRALYLLFSEGYHGASPETPVRGELCTEAMRLTAMLLEHPLGKTTPTYALAALMSLHAARLPARVDDSGNLTSLSEQDRSKWNQELIGEGIMLLEHSARGSEISEYHIEAAIALSHACAASAEETNWDAIISMYDILFAMSPTPIVALNRSIAVGQRHGPDRGLEAIASIPDKERLLGYPFYFATLGELELRRGGRQAARAHFNAAAALARNPKERRFLEARIKASEERSHYQFHCGQFWDEALAKFKVAAEVAIDGP